MQATDPPQVPVQRTILVTDSGLGGFSVFNDIANRLRHQSPWETVRLIYFNAWPAPHRGYNHYTTPEKKIRIFDNAVRRMAQYRPHQILIACNTLSVIYPRTPSAGSMQIPVEGIVDLGAEIIFEKLTGYPDSKVLILGTPTTTQARTHEHLLAKKGIDRGRVVNIACTDLAGWIEREPFSPTVGEMIDRFAAAAAQALGDFNGRVFAALCCTHFGYRRQLFEQAFARRVAAPVTILNPNEAMARRAFELNRQPSAGPARIEMQIVSKAMWPEEKVDAYLRLLPDISPSTAEALKHYTHDDRLFAVDEA